MNFEEMLNGVMNNKNRCVRAFTDRIRPAFVHSCSSRAQEIHSCTGMGVKEAADTAMDNFWIMLCKNEFALMKKCLANGEQNFDHYVAKCAKGIAMNLLDSDFKQADCRLTADYEVEDWDAPTIDWDVRRRVVDRLLCKLAGQQRAVMQAVLDNVDSENPLPQHLLAEKCGMAENNFNHSKHQAIKNLQRLVAEMGGSQIDMAA